MTKLNSLLCSEKNPYSRSIIGTEEGLNSFTVEDANKFYRTYYVPNNMSIAIVGDIKLHETLGLVAKHFGAMERGDLPERSEFFEKKQKKKREETITHRGLISPQLAVAYKVVPQKHEDTPDLMLLISLLTWGKSSLLEQDLVEKGLVSSVQGEAIFYENFGKLMIYVDFLSTTKKRDVIAVIGKAFQKIKDGNIDPSQFRAARNLLLLKQYYPVMDDNQKLTNVLLDGLQLTGNPLDFFEEMEKIKKLKLSDLQKLLLKYIKLENTSIVLGKPKPKPVKHPDKKEERKK